MGTKVIRVFVFDKPVPDPFKEWHWFAGVLAGRARCRRQAHGDFRQVPSALRRPGEHPQFRRPLLRDRLGMHRAVGRGRGEGLVLVHLERAQQSASSAAMSASRSIVASMRMVGAAVLELLGPHLGGRKAQDRGPGDRRHATCILDGLDCATGSRCRRQDARLRQLAHVWRTGGRRCRARRLAWKCGDAPDSPNGRVFETLAMAQTPQYEARARGVARLLSGRDILNVCGELNTVAHHEHYYTLGLNQNAFGAAYYASALIHLMRGGADLEMRWTATSSGWTGAHDDCLRPDVDMRRADARVPGQAALRPARAAMATGSAFPSAARSP